MTPLCRKRSVDGGLAGYFIVGVGEIDAEGVVLSIDAGLSLVVVGEGRKGAQQETRSDNRRTKLWHKPLSSYYTAIRLHDATLRINAVQMLAWRRWAWLPARGSSGDCRCSTG